ncbi:MAG: hypothetical protein ACOYL6_18765 [Bacteriovoracaceae bacterium]
MKEILLTYLCVLSISAFSHEGNGSSGGGNSVIFPDGSVKLVDLINKNELPSAPASEKLIKQKFFSGTRYVRQFGKKDKTFFSCAIKKFNDSGIKSLKALSEKLYKVDVFQVEIRLGQKKSQTTDSPVAYFSTASTKFPSEYQEPLAAFNKGQVWVAKRFYDRLPEDHKCGLGVHEALRYMNFTDIISEPLTTEEIELTTSDIINQKEISLKKLSNLKIRWAEVAERTSDIRNEVNLVVNDESCLIESTTRKALWQSATTFSDIGRWTDGNVKDRDMMFEKTKIFTNILFTGINSGTSFNGSVKDKCYVSLRNTYYKMLDLIDDMIIQSVLTLGDELNENMARHLEYGMNEILFLDMAVEHKLPWYKRIDTWNNKIVSE